MPMPRKHIPGGIAVNSAEQSRFPAFTKFVESLCAATFGPRFTPEELERLEELCRCASQERSSAAAPKENLA